MSKVPLKDQIKAGKALLAGDSADGRALEALWKTLTWMQKNPDVLKAGAELMRHDAVLAIKTAFPGTELHSINSLDPVEE